MIDAPISSLPVLADEKDKKIKGYCECGCEQLAPLAKKTRPERGWIKGQPIRYIHGHNMVGNQFRLGQKRPGSRPDNIPRMLGPNNPRWKGGITPRNRILRNSSKYKIWRYSVFERDDYTCQTCGQRGGDLNADHIKSWADFPQFRFSISNGRTLCVPCHRKTSN